jgi:ABC-2 type transport system ATP-binding protein
VAAPALHLDAVEVRFGSVLALDAVDLRVDAGSIVAVLGHNGAGKTTLVRVAATLLRPDRGRVTIGGVDAVGDPRLARRSIGVTGQYAGLDEHLTGEENLAMVGRLLGLGREVGPRVGAIVERLGLAEIARQRVGRMSGGSRRRVDLAASLVGRPSLLFLDEPTTGLDPVARQQFWDVVRDEAAGGTAVVLTTQYLEEADDLADEVVVLRRGSVIAKGTPAELKERVGGKVVRATMASSSTSLTRLGAVGVATMDGDLATITAPLQGAADAAAMIHALVAGGASVTDLEVTSPSLDDVFHHFVEEVAA